MSPLHCTDHSLVSAAELFYLSFASRKAHSFWWFPHRIIQTHLKSKKVNFPSICLLGVPVCWSPWLLCACLCLSLSFYLFISLSSHLSLFGRNCRGRKFIFVFLLFVSWVLLFCISVFIFETFYFCQKQLCLMTDYTAYCRGSYFQQSIHLNNNSQYKEMSL